LRRADDCAYGSHVRLVESLIRPLAILIGGYRHRRRRLVDVLRVTLERADRRYGFIETHPRQRAVASRAQNHASASELFVLAGFPPPAFDDHRGRAIVEAVPGEVAHFPVCGECATAKAFTFIECD